MRTTCTLIPWSLDRDRQAKDTENNLTSFDIWLRINISQYL